MTAIGPPFQHPLTGYSERTVIRIEMKDGHILTGSYTGGAGFHFVHRTGANLPPLGEVVGPILAEDIVAARVLKTREEVLAEAHYKLFGDRVPGREPVTREDFQSCLEAIARAIAGSEADWRREMQLHRQFNDVADRIGLSAGKRTWLLSAPRWATRSNAPATLSDLWPDAVASPRA
jgi:hypothetical protein